MTNKELLFSVSVKDCEMQTYRGPGNGGQKKQKTSSGVRLIHHPSGARAQCHENREQSRNKEVAWKRLIDTREFKLWHKLETARLLGKPSIEQIVDQQMKESNLKIEVKDEEGKWKETKEVLSEEV